MEKVRPERHDIGKKFDDDYYSRLEEELTIDFMLNTKTNVFEPVKKLLSYDNTQKCV